MENELKPCPFCGKPAGVTFYDGVEYAICANDNCGVFGLNDAPGAFDAKWNTRPLEDMLLSDIRAAQDENAKLRAELEAVRNNLEDSKALLDWARSDYDKIKTELQQARDIIRNMHADEFIEGHNRMVGELRQVRAALKRIASYERRGALAYALASIAKSALPNPPADDIAHQEE